MCRSASKSAAATPRLARSSGSPNDAEASSKRPSPLFKSKASRIPFGPDHGRGQVEVELAVAVGVEGGDGRAEAGADPADHRQRAGEVGRLDPALALGSLTCSGWAASKLGRDRRGLRRSDSVARNGLTTRGILAHLAVLLLGRVARAGRPAPGDRD